ncbi:glycoside hydrolase family 97 N-terminal domain-containing protein, partial [Reichenbachiella sp.]
MKKIILFMLTLNLIGCGTDQTQKLQTALSSPSVKISMEFYLEADGSPGYLVNYGEKAVLDSARLGFELGNQVSLKNGFEIVKTSTSSFDETWEQPWGEQRLIRNNYNELKVELINASQIRLNVIFRLFDDGIGFRYEFPEQEKLGEFEIMDELTEFNFPEDHDAWSIPAYAGNRYEYLYQKAPISEFGMVHTPLTIEAKNGLFFHMHEAALYDYPSMVVKNMGGTKLKCDLVPYSKTNPVKAYLKTPFSTPWRTLQIGETPGDLITNYTILNLNEPSKIEDTSWIQPGKYIGVWWEMFINIGTWHKGPKHAANTENVKKYIDFAAANGFSGVLVEGWNYG